MRKRGIAFEALDNGILSCANPKALQRICEGLDDKKIDRLLRKWLARLPTRNTAQASALYAGIRPGAALMTDGYAPYDAVADRYELVHLGCWSHARRYLVEAEEALPKAHVPVMAHIAPESKGYHVLQNSANPRSPQCGDRSFEVMR